MAALIPESALNAAGFLSYVNSDGERLAPELTAVAAAAAHVPVLRLTGSSVAVSRRNLEFSAQAMAQSFPPFAVEEDLLIDGPGGPMGATRYRADAASSRGLLLFFHGGGFVIGSRITHDSAVRALAVASGADVLSVDYRTAPEHKFPAAVDDALAAWRFAVEKAPQWGLDPRKIAVAGDSAGGNLAAGLCHQVRDDDVTPCLQVLIYPVVDVSKETASYREFADGFFLTEKDMRWFVDHYLPDDDVRTDPRVSPLLADDFSGLPPAYVLVAGFDPLRDEGLAYAAELTGAGVPTQVVRAGDAMHGFLNMGLISPTAREHVDRIGAAVIDAMR
ncbi:MAG: alpha/beta hydrolase [Gordonia sp. (in: high G+C Gram-positive bacteria)]